MAAPITANWNLVFLLFRMGLFQSFSYTLFPWLSMISLVFRPFCMTNFQSTPFIQPFCMTYFHFLFLLYGLEVTFALHGSLY